MALAAFRNFFDKIFAPLNIALILGSGPTGVTGGGKSKQSRRNCQNEKG